MSRYDFSSVQGEIRGGGYQAGPTILQVGKWSFEESKSGKPYLLMEWNKEGVIRDDGRPFTSSRLYFSSPKAIQIARGKLHDLCDILNVDYDADLMTDDDYIINFGEKLHGRSLNAELVETGGKSEKGLPFLGVRLRGQDGQKVDLFIQEKGDANYSSPRHKHPSPRMEDMDTQDSSDIPF